MSIQLVDSGVHSAGALNGQLSWLSHPDGVSNEMQYSGGGTIFANVSFSDCGNYWSVGAGSAYQYVEMQWINDFGVGSFEVFAQLYVCLDANVGTGSVTGYQGNFYNDGSTLVVDIYDFSGFGGSYLGNIFGFSQAFVGDTIALEYNDSSGEVGVYLNGGFIGSINDFTHSGSDIQAIGSQVGWAEFGNVYMEQPSGAGGQTVNLTGIASAQAFGTATPTPGNLNRSIIGIPSAEAFGTIGALNETVPGLTGIPSGEAFGTPSPPSQTVGATGIPSQEAFGGIGGMNEQVPITGIPSGEAFGNVTITGGIQSAGNPTRLLMTGAGN